MSAFAETITWHPVDEQLPDDDTTVLVQYDDPGQEIEMGYRDAEVWRGTDAMRLGLPVVAWAELPAGIPRA